MPQKKGEGNLGVNKEKVDLYPEPTGDEMSPALRDVFFAQ